MTDPREPTDAEWVRLSESWTAATETPWRFEQEQGRCEDIVCGGFLVAAIVAALIVAVAWLAWTR